MTRKTNRYKDKEYHYYYCPTGKKNGCTSSVMLKESDLIECVQDSLKGHIENVASLDALLSSISQERINRELAQEYAAQIRVNEKRVAQTEGFKAKLYENPVSYTHLNDEQLTIFRRRNIGFIFQNYNLVPILNVYENIVLPVELDGDTVDQKFLDEIVHLLGLEDKLKNMPNNLSGGQQQRVAIARALITKPAIVLADEPTGNLDSKTSAEVLGLIKRTSAEFRQTVVMITHNDDIARLADRIVRIEDGKIVE